MMEYVELNSGTIMPMVGLGTHKIPNDQLPMIIACAYELGYRKFDTAWLYGNEQVIGEALKKSSIPRDKVFITSKLHINNLYLFGFHNKYPNLRVRSVRKAFEDSCRRLKTDYLDLYLVHWPFKGYEKMWEDVITLYSESRIKSIGVSSFLPKHLEVLMKKTSIKPAVNQFEINPMNSQVENTLFNQNIGIHVEAYASFGTTKVTETASDDILGDKTILNIAEKYCKSPSQVVLRWTIQRGISVIPRSKSKTHLAENLNVFDFSLSEMEMQAINALNKNKYYRYNPHYA